ncbi:MAG: TonB-dependent receptor [Gammaproteobacteria bacterium]|nr:TonB-dependent receptor [Gammaproteobacteria bacterium]
MSEKKSKIWLLTNNHISLLAGFVCLPFTAQANVESLLELSLEELMNVSVASLFDESVLEASSSVTVINQNVWESNGARRTNEIMSYQPSTMVHPTLGGSDAFAIRGFSNSLSVRGVATLLDGVPMNTYSFGTAQYFLANFDLGALQRAELIRGPGSAVYGSDAFHGVFSLSTFSPGQDMVESELGIGSPGYARGHARFSQSVGESSRMYGAFALTQQADSSISFQTSDPNVQGVREDAYASKTAYLKTQNKLSQHWDSEFGLYYNNWNATDFPSFGEAELGSDGVALGADDVSDGQQEFYMLTANASYSWGQHKTFELKTFFWNTDQQFEYQFADVPLQAQEDERYGMSLTVKDEGGKNAARWVLGAGVDKAEVVSTELIAGVQAFDGQKRSINNVFAQLRLPFYEGKLLLDIGSRVDDYSDFGSHFTPRLGLVYLLDDNQALKFQYGNAFRAPVASELTSSGRIQGNPDLTPETIDTYELIWMKHENLYTFTTTLYMSNWQDAIIIVDDSTLPAPFETRYENQGEFNSQGVELESSVLIDNWKIDGAYSFIKSEDKTKQQDFMAFPKHILQLGLKTGINSNLDVRLYNIAYFDVSANTAQSAKKLDTIWQLNLNVNYQWKNNLNLALDIRNLLNRKDPVPSIWGNEEGLPVDGVQLSTYIRYKF